MAGRLQKNHDLALPWVMVEVEEEGEGMMVTVLRAGSRGEEEEMKVDTGPAVKIDLEDTKRRENLTR